jgi:hypothetical protein
MDSSNVKRRFNIPSANVDIDTVTVFVQTSTTNTTTVEYIRAGDVTELDGTSKVYFVEEDGEGTYVIYFGDNIIGKKPDNGNVIIVNYLDTVGEEANKISTFSFAQSVTDGLFRDNTPITADGPTFGGTEKETISDVRFRAPYAYAAQNRAVTKSDYETLISRTMNISILYQFGVERTTILLFTVRYSYRSRQKTTTSLQMMKSLRLPIN